MTAPTRAPPSLTARIPRASKAKPRATTAAGKALEWSRLITRCYAFPAVTLSHVTLRNLELRQADPLLRILTEGKQKPVISTLTTAAGPAM